jgi:hypothetical protein
VQGGGEYLGDLGTRLGGPGREACGGLRDGAGCWQGASQGSFGCGTAHHGTARSVVHNTHARLCETSFLLHRASTAVMPQRCAQHMNRVEGRQRT